MNGLCECGCGQAAPIATMSVSKRGIVKGQPLHFVQGHNTTSHRMSRQPEYQSFISAKRRCTNPTSDHWKSYGGRGIRFLFESPEQLLKEIGPRPEGMTLDRIDNDSHYMVGNVRWANASTQRLNQRKSARVPLRITLTQVRAWNRKEVSL